MEIAPRPQDLRASGVLSFVEGRHKKKARDDDPEPDRPPGDFMEERFADDTARFLAEVKRLADRRAREDRRPGGWAAPG